MRTVVGVDSGGSKTRALAVSLEGKVVGSAITGGGNPSHDPNHIQNIKSAIELAAKPSGIENVVGLVAGIAGNDDPKDAEWVATATAADGLNAPQTHVNDADVAHYGAFSGAPGIISIQGAGSMIMAITDTGRRIRNYDYLQYALAAAPWIGFRTIMMLLIEGQTSEDAFLVDGILKHWDVKSVAELREFWSTAKQRPFHVLRKREGAMAPLVTAAAEAGSPLAAAVCLEASVQIVDGIRLLGREFTDDSVRVVPIGGCVRSRFVRRAVERGLAEATEKSYTVQDPICPPVVGAVLMALKREGILLSQEAIDQLVSDADRVLLPNSID